MSWCAVWSVVASASAGQGNRVPQGTRCRLHTQGLGCPAVRACPSGWETGPRHRGSGSAGPCLASLGHRHPWSQREPGRQWRAGIPCWPVRKPKRGAAGVWGGLVAATRRAGVSPLRDLSFGSWGRGGSAPREAGEPCKGVSANTDLSSPSRSQEPLIPRPHIQGSVQEKLTGGKTPSPALVASPSGSGVGVSGPGRWAPPSLIPRLASLI